MGIKEAHLQELIGANKLMVKVGLIEGKKLSPIADEITKVLTDSLLVNYFSVLLLLRTFCLTTICSSG